MSERLTVWLYGTPVAHLDEPNPFRYRLRFTEAALDEFGENSRVLSLGLPITRTEVRDRDHRTGTNPVGAFLEGLLPEGNLRTQLAAALNVASFDKMALLRHVGRECAGAVQFMPEGQAPSRGRVIPLSDSDVADLVADLPTYHLVDSIPQASLAGIQDKVLLARIDDESWGLPVEGAASTHLVKPQPLTGSLPGLVEAEHWALRVARDGGLNAAHSSLASFRGRSAVIVERYDRINGRRVHQEDLCQALGLPPGDKYERQGEHRLRNLVRLATPQAADPVEFQHDILAAVVANAVLGNGDAHSKNYSLLISPAGAVTLAPLYDVAPVMALDPKFGSTGHFINNKSRINHLTVHDFVEEATTWGMSRAAAEKTVVGTMTNLADTVRAESPGATEELHRMIKDRLEAAWTQRQWPIPQWADNRTSPGTRDATPAGPTLRLHPPAANAGDVWVEPHQRRGKQVQGHWRRRPVR